MSINKAAVISDCTRYRYSLLRQWDIKLPQAVLIGLNPSTADGEVDDPTVKKLVRMCIKWGYGGYRLVNLFAYRATDPSALKGLSTAYIVGPLNEQFIKSTIKSMNPDDILIFMWGAIANDVSKSHTEKIFNLYWKRAHYLKLNKDSSPSHPLYLADSTKPRKYR